MHVINCPRERFITDERYNSSSFNGCEIRSEFADPGTSMDVVEDCVTESINPDSFPAKLWRLVNNPVNEAICWDKDGLVVVIDQTLVEQQVLSPRNSSSASNNSYAFKTANFSSFVRNLNSYGFKVSDTYNDKQYRYYYHPNFMRDHPELVASLTRLTVANKAELIAGTHLRQTMHVINCPRERFITDERYNSNSFNGSGTFNGCEIRSEFADPGTSMDVVEDCVTESINPDSFPAKLWRLVNNPVNEAICWDKDGLVVVIDQTLVEQQVLSPRKSSSASNNSYAFKTANFSSFVRNLNSYGFKVSDTYDDKQYRYYYHPNFMRDHPELVASLTRLTVANKAELIAGTHLRQTMHVINCPRERFITDERYNSNSFNGSGTFNGCEIRSEFADPGTSMDVVEDCVTESINPDSFPAKLWRLVNNPVNEAICWDKDGLVVVIDQTLVEQQVLSPRKSSSASNNSYAFKTANFSSFVRNLNLYGFKVSDTYDDKQYRYYYHPNFMRDHPELVASLTRLTVANKAKLIAGLEAFFHAE